MGHTKDKDILSRTLKVKTFFRRNHPHRDSALRGGRYREQLHQPEAGPGRRRPSKQRRPHRRHHHRRLKQNLEKVVKSKRTVYGFDIMKYLEQTKGHNKILLLSLTNIRKM